MARRGIIKRSKRGKKEIKGEAELQRKKGGEVRKARGMEWDQHTLTRSALTTHSKRWKVAHWGGRTGRSELHA